MKQLQVHLAILLCPQKSNGFIDEEELFAIIVGTLKLCTITDYENFIEETQPFVVGLLLNNHIGEQKDHYEMLAQAVRIGTVSAQKGKHIPMFKKQENQVKTQKTTTEEKQQMFAELDNIFGE